MNQLSQCASVPCEFERLIVPDVVVVEDDDDDDDEEEDSHYDVLLEPKSVDIFKLQRKRKRRFTISRKAFQGRVARAVSLCLYNKLQMAHIHWPETMNLTRRATCQLDETYQSGHLPLSKSADVYPTDDTHRHLLAVSPTVDDFEADYAGLTELDETRLSRLIETDLISSNL